MVQAVVLLIALGSTLCGTAAAEDEEAVPPPALTCEANTYFDSAAGECADCPVGRSAEPGAMDIAECACPEGLFALWEPPAQEEACTATDQALCEAWTSDGTAAPCESSAEVQELAASCTYSSEECLPEDDCTFAGTPDIPESCQAPDGSDEAVVAACAGALAGRRRMEETAVEPVLTPAESCVAADAACIYSASEAGDPALIETCTATHLAACTSWTSDGTPAPCTGAGPPGGTCVDDPWGMLDEQCVEPGGGGFLDMVAYAGIECDDEIPDSADPNDPNGNNFLLKDLCPLSCGNCPEGTRIEPACTYTREFVPSHECVPCPSGTEHFTNFDGCFLSGVPRENPGPAISDPPPEGCEAVDAAVPYCCDGDGSCFDGDDDWCCGEGVFFCSNDGAEYAEGRGGIECPAAERDDCEEWWQPGSNLLPCDGGATLDTSTGSITFMDSYGNNAECTWTITCPTHGTTPSLQFSAMDTESCCDYITLYDGNSTLGTQLQQYSGSHGSVLPDPVQASAQALTITFTSDGNFVRQGFSADFDCGEELQSPELVDDEDGQLLDQLQSLGSVLCTGSCSDGVHTEQAACEADTDCNNDGATGTCSDLQYTTEATCVAASCTGDSICVATCGEGNRDGMGPCGDGNEGCDQDGQGPDWIPEPINALPCAAEVCDSGRENAYWLAPDAEACVWSADVCTWAGACVSALDGQDPATVVDDLCWEPSDEDWNSGWDNAACGAQNRECWEHSDTLEQMQACYTGKSACAFALDLLAADSPYSVLGDHCVADLASIGVVDAGSGSVLSDLCPMTCEDPGPTTREIQLLQTCVPCEPGTIDHDSNPDTPCVNCDPNGYQGSQGMTQCVDCPQGKKASRGAKGEYQCGVEPVYVGCAEDRESFTEQRDLTGARFDMELASTATCFELCAGFTYMGMQALDTCFCDNEYGDYGETPRDDMCGMVGDACGRNDPEYVGFDGAPNTCAMTNAIFVLPHWTCSDVTCAEGTAAKDGVREMSVLGLSDDLQQSSCCQMSCLAWHDGTKRIQMTLHIHTSYYGSGTHYSSFNTNLDGGENLEYPSRSETYFPMLIGPGEHTLDFDIPYPYYGEYWSIYAGTVEDEDSAENALRLAGGPSDGYIYSSGTQTFTLVHAEDTCVSPFDGVSWVADGACDVLSGACATGTDCTDCGDCNGGPQQDICDDELGPCVDDPEGMLYREMDVTCEALLAMMGGGRRRAEESGCATSNDCSDTTYCCCDTDNAESEYTCDPCIECCEDQNDVGGICPDHCSCGSEGHSSCDETWVDDPDGQIAALGFDCAGGYAQAGGDCEFDLALMGVVDSGSGTLLGDHCPVTCDSCINHDDGGDIDLNDVCDIDLNDSPGPFDVILIRTLCPMSCNDCGGAAVVPEDAVYCSACTPCAAGSFCTLESVQGDAAAAGPCIDDPNREIYNLGVRLMASGMMPPGMDINCESALMMSGNDCNFDLAMQGMVDQGSGTRVVDHCPLSCEVCSEPVPAFEINDDDPCELTQEGSCFGRPSGYEDAESCTITTLSSVTLSCSALETEAGYGTVTIDGTDYNGADCPDGVILPSGSAITWSSDGSESQTGWEICVHVDSDPREFRYGVCETCNDCSAPGLAVAGNHDCTMSCTMPVTVPLRVSIITALGGAEMTWNFDGGQTYGPYADNTQAHEVLQLAVGEHVLNLMDSGGDGWGDGAFWALSDPSEEYVDAAPCIDDPNREIYNLGVRLMASGMMPPGMDINCETALMMSGNDCNFDLAIQGMVDQGSGTRVVDHCPLSCEVCSEPATLAGEVLGAGSSFTFYITEAGDLLEPLFTSDSMSSICVATCGQGNEDHMGPCGDGNGACNDGPDYIPEIHAVPCAAEVCDSGRENAYWLAVDVHVEDKYGLPPPLPPPTVAPASTGSDGICVGETRYMPRLAEDIPAFVDAIGTDSQANCCTAPCEPGSYDNDSRCEPCPAGTISTEEDASECTACNAGEYAPPGSDSCTLCPPGQHDGDSDPATACQDCARGLYSEAPGAFSCDGTCDPGTFSDTGAPSSDHCVQCDAGRSDHDSSGSTACLLCSTGRYTAAEGHAGECATCAEGQTAVGGAVTCTPVEADTADTPPVDSVTGTLALAGDMLAVAGAEDSEERVAFEVNFIADIALTLGVDESQVTIVGIVDGSVQVTFAVAPSETGEIVAPSELAAAFSEEVILLSVGVTTTGAVSGVAVVEFVGSPGCTDSSAANYDSSKDVNDGSCVYDCRLGGWRESDGTDGTEVCYLYSHEASAWETTTAEPLLWDMLATTDRLIVQGSSAGTLPQFDSSPALTGQSLILRHVRVENNDVSGSAGAITCVASALEAEHVEYVGNTQRGVGSAVIFADGSHVTVGHSKFENNVNVGLGAAALYGIAGSTLEVSDTQFTGGNLEISPSFPADYTLKSASAIAVADSALSLARSSFAENTGIDTIVATASTVDVSHTTFEANVGFYWVEEVVGPPVCLAQCIGNYDYNRGPCNDPSGDTQSCCYTYSYQDTYSYHDMFVDHPVHGRSCECPDFTCTERDNAMWIPEADAFWRPAPPPPDESDLDWREGAIVSLLSGSVGTFTHTSFINNRGNSAGALYISNENSSVMFQHMVFTANDASHPVQAAGAVLVSDGGYAEGTQASFTNNTAAAQWASGAIFVTASSVWVVDATFDGNKADEHEFMGTRAGSGSIYSDSSTLDVERATVQNNVALGATPVSRMSYADAVYVSTPIHIRLASTTFSPFDPVAGTVAITPGAIAGVLMGGCEQHPCNQGEQCSYANYSVSCDPCPDKSYSDDGVMCRFCDQGHGPTIDQTGCLACEGNNHSTFGVCLPCPEVQVVADDHKRCESCPVRQTAIPGPSADAKRTCGCDDNFYNETDQLMVCFDDRGYDEAQYDAAWSMRQQTVSENQYCQTCAMDRTGEPCIVCAKGVSAHVRAGFTIPQLPALDSDDEEDTTRRSLKSVNEPKMVFRCHDDMEVGARRCPENPPEAGQCALGYAGYLCSSCAADYGMMTTRRCELCDDVGYTPKSMMMLGGIIVGLTLFGILFAKYWKVFPAKYAVRCAFQPMRIFITYAQITSQLGDVLSFEYPPEFAAVIEAIKPIMDIWGLLFRALGSSECFGLVGFTARWMLRVVALPLILCIVVAIVYTFEKRGKTPDKANTHAKGNLFFVTFFCYPTICTVAFASFICRSFSKHHSVLMADDSVLCEAADHKVIMILSYFVVVFFAFGIPVAFGGILIKKARKYERETKGTNTALARRIAEDLDVDEVNAEFVIRDVVIGADYSFLMDAFSPRYLYWEALDMLRKLALVGLVLLVGRGSTAQLMSALLLSFGFFALQLKISPYKISQDNTYRAATEFHVFIVIAIALVLGKTDLSREAVPYEFYDWFLFGTWLLLVPIGFVLTVINKLRFVKHVLYGDETGPKRAFNRLYVGLKSEEDVEDFKAYLDKIRTQVVGSEFARAIEGESWRAKRLQTGLKKQVKGIMASTKMSKLLGGANSKAEPLLPSKKEELEERWRSAGGVPEADSDESEAESDSADESDGYYGKFDGGFEGIFADMTDYFGGLEKIIGECRKDLIAAMEEEHTELTSGFGASDTEFSTSSYRVRTTPRNEWHFVVNPNTVGEMTAGLDRETGRARGIRQKRIVEDLMAHAAALITETFKELGLDRVVTDQEVKELQLLPEEIIAMRLYTGPMFEIYNSVLRAWGNTPRGFVPPYAMVGAGMDVRGCFTTTLHVLNSGVLKMARLQPALPVYRGFSRMQLPKAFTELNQDNVRGGVEYGFMSTTTDKEVALTFAKDGDRKTSSTLVVANMGMVDRGASLSWLSQYPHEREVLFAPLTALEVTDITDFQDEGAFNIRQVTVRLNCNLLSMTIEKLLAVRKKQVRELAEIVKKDIVKHEEDPDIRKRIWKLEDVQEGIEVEASRRFNDNAYFSHSVNEVMDVMPKLGDEVAILSAHSGGIYGLALTNASTGEFASSSWDGTTRLWSLNDDKEYSCSEPTALPGASVAFAHTGEHRFASGQFDGAVALQHMGNKEEALELTTGRKSEIEGVTALAWSGNSESGSTVTTNAVDITLDETQGDETSTAAILRIPAFRRSAAQHASLLGWVQSVQFFNDNATSDFHAKEIAKKLEVEDFGAEEAIMRQGDVGDAFYVILSGSVKVVVDDKDTVVVDVPGTGVGERALQAEHGQRTSTVIARTATVMAKLEAADYHECMRAEGAFQQASGNPLEDQKRELLAQADAYLGGGRYDEAEDAICHAERLDGYITAQLVSDDGTGTLSLIPDSKAKNAPEVTMQPLLASGCMDGRVSVWMPDSADAQPSKLAHTVGGPPKEGHSATGHTSTVRTLIWVKPYGHQLLLTGDFTGHIIVWRVSSTGTLEEERRLRDETDGLEGGCKEKGSAHLGGITALVSPSPGSTTLVSGSADGAIKVWDLLEGGPPRTLLQCPRGICSLAWLHRPHGGNDGPMTNWLACGLGDNTIQLVDVKDGSTQATLRGHSNGVHSLVWLEAKGWLASGSGDATIRIWRVRTDTHT